MDAGAITLFFVMMYCFGFSATFFIKKTDDFFEKFFMNIAVGIGVFAVVAALLAILKIPLLWYFFLIISLIMPVYSILRKKPSFKFEFKLKKSHLYFAVVLVLFALTLLMYLKGAFAYPLYEDGDPWRHSGIAKYISLTKTALEPWQGADILQYIDSYPPGYDTLFSLMHQFSGELIWSVKFFNSLLVSLGIIFFYFFAKQFTKRNDIALTATFILAVTPCYMSHFIWALTLAVVLIYPLFYCLEKISEDKKWIYPAALCYAGILLSQPTHAAKISVILGIYLAAKSVLLKKIQWRHFISAFLGGIISFIWWVPMYFKYGSIKALVLGAGTSTSVLKGAEGFSLKFHGTADRIYTFADFFYANAQNMINNPIGVGVVLMILLFFTLLYIVWKYKSLLNEENHWVLITGLWLLFAFIGIHGERLPVQFWAFRFWMLFAIFFSLFAAYGLSGFINIMKKFSVPALLIIILFVVGAWYTSGAVKWQINTGSWEHTAGEFIAYTNSEEKIQLTHFDSWKFVSELPTDTKVFFPCRNQKNMDVGILGIDKYSCLWCRDEKDFKMSFMNHTGEELIDFAKGKGYEYVFIDANCLGGFNANLTLFNNYLVNMSSKAQLAQKSDGGFVWKI